jgi:hypothetical protein
MTDTPLDTAPGRRLHPVFPAVIALSAVAVAHSCSPSSSSAVARGPPDAGAAASPSPARLSERDERPSS